MTDRQSTCEERIDEHMKASMENVTNAMLGYSNDCYNCGHEWPTKNEPAICPGCSSDNLSTELSVNRYLEGVLSFEKTWTVYRVTLSTGGPADGFWLYVDEDKDLVKAEYWFQDWFDGARRNVARKDLVGLENLFRFMWDS